MSVDDSIEGIYNPGGGPVGGKMLARIEAYLKTKLPGADGVSVSNLSQ